MFLIYHKVKNVRLQRICADFNCDGKTQKHNENRPKEMHQKSNCSRIRQCTAAGCGPHLLTVLLLMPYYFTNGGN